MAHSRIPHDHHHSRAARRWIPANKSCLSDGSYLANTFSVSTSVFPEEHILNRRDIFLVLTREEEFGTLLDDLNLMFGSQGLPKLYMCRKSSHRREYAIQSENLVQSLYRLQTRPSRWRLDVQFPKRIRSAQVPCEEEGNTCSLDTGMDIPAMSTTATDHYAPTATHGQQPLVHDAQWSDLTYPGLDLDWGDELWYQTDRHDTYMNTAS